MAGRQDIVAGRTGREDIEDNAPTITTIELLMVGPFGEGPPHGWLISV